MPRPRAKTDVPRECQGCHHTFARSHFKLSHVYCNRCFREFSGAVNEATAAQVAAIDGGMIEKLQQVLESNDPDMPQVMSRVLELYGGHEALARSLVLMMARQEGRYHGGRILSHAEAEALGVLIPIKKPELFRQCMKMLFDALHDTNIFKRAGNPYDGVSVSDMEAQIAQVAWDRMGTDAKFQDLILAKLENDTRFQDLILARIKGNESLMRRLMDVKAIIPVVSERREVVVCDV